MQNLDQIRALNALKATEKYTPKGENGGNVIKQVPAMIQQNGLLGAMAFAFDDKPGHKAVLQGAIEHYASVCNGAPATIEEFAGWIITQDAAMLRAATAEILAYLNYYRRFASANLEEAPNANRN